MLPFVCYSMLNTLLFLSRDALSLLLSILSLLMYSLHQIFYFYRSMQSSAMCLCVESYPLVPWACYVCNMISHYGMRMQRWQCTWQPRWHMLCHISWDCAAVCTHSSCGYHTESLLYNCLKLQSLPWRAPKPPRGRNLVVGLQLCMSLQRTRRCENFFKTVP